MKLAEVMKFRMDPNNLEPARANYPKTNDKRLMDKHNNEMGKWVRQAESHGYVVQKRMEEDEADTSVFDAIDPESGEQKATLVVNGQQTRKPGDVTYDYFNQTQEGMQNEYTADPAEIEYDYSWEFRTQQGHDKHHSDQRNVFTSNSHGRTMANSRQKDGYISLQDIISSSRRGKS